jgi:hypothetical protein
LGDAMGRLLVRAGSNLMEKAMTRRGAGGAKANKGDIVSIVAKGAAVMIQEEGFLTARPRFSKSSPVAPNAPFSFHRE